MLVIYLYGREVSSGLKINDTYIEVPNKADLSTCINYRNQGFTLTLSVAQLLRKN